MNEEKEITTPSHQAVVVSAPKRKELTIVDIMNKSDVVEKFKKMMGDNAVAFITSVLQIASDDNLKDADPMSIYNCACTAATLNLPLNNNLGWAYIVPYNRTIELDPEPDGKGGFKAPRKVKKKFAQFQMGYKGFKELARRSGKLNRMHSSDVREGEIKHINRLTSDIEFEWIQDEDLRQSKKVIGYVAYFSLHDGFAHTLYMTVKELDAHGIRYSKSLQSGYGLWKDDYPKMCLKTVTKLNLDGNAPLSIEMQLAIKADQGVIKDENATVIEYPDNPTRQVKSADDKKKELKQNDSTIPPQLP